jgi:hypothetical protein
MCDSLSTCRLDPSHLDYRRGGSHLEIVDEARFVMGMGGRINASRPGLVSEIEGSLTKQFTANKSLERFCGGGRGSRGRSATAQLFRWAALDCQLDK